jgi:hypothetical protein
MVIVQHRTPYRTRTNRTDPVTMNIVNIVTLSYPLSDQYESSLTGHDRYRNHRNAFVPPIVRVRIVMVGSRWTS